MAGKTTNLQLQKIDNTDYAGNFPTIYNNNLDLIDVLNNKQDKLIAGSGITIASDGKTISSDGEKPWIPIENLNDVASLFQMSNTYPINWTLLKKIRLKINVIIDATSYTYDKSFFFHTTNAILPFTWHINEESYEKNALISIGVDTFGYVAKSEKPGLCSIYMRLDGRSNYRGIYFYLSITGQDQLFKIFKISPNGSITTYERITYDTNLPSPNFFSHGSTYPTVHFYFEYQD